MNEIITLDSLQAALVHCMAVHPPTGAERRLHPDVNRLADVFGLMVYERTRSMRREAMPPEVVEIYLRWLPPSRRDVQQQSGGGTANNA